MRSLEEKEKIIELWKDDRNNSWIAKHLGIPRCTVRDVIFRYQNPIEKKSMQLQRLI